MEDKKIRPQDKWDAKAGVVAKTYKVSTEADKEFRDTCKKLGLSLGTTLSKLMKEFSEENR